MLFWRVGIPQGIPQAILKERSKTPQWKSKEFHLQEIFKKKKKSKDENHMDVRFSSFKIRWIKIYFLNRNAIFNKFHKCKDAGIIWM